MIEIVQGDIFASACHAMVNPVNCVGVMGKGLALAFKKRWPSMFVDYQRACRNGTLAIGRMHPYQVSDGVWVINFPTKDHWRNPSKLEYIEKGLEDLKQCVRSIGLTSVAIPALGCGLGELDWPLVKARIHLLGAALPEVLIKLYEPR